MARKQFSTTIEDEISNKFKDYCKNTGINMNLVLEAMMESYIADKFIITIMDGKINIEAKPKDKFQK